MSFENNAFPHATGTAFNQYGPRETQDGQLSGGVTRTAGVMQEVVVYINGSDFTSGSFDTRATLPAGSTFVEAIAEVTEAFVLGGTSPTINVGTNGSEGTNFGIELSEANAEATGTYYNDTGAGTWAAPLAADTVIGVALDGTTPTVTAAGEAKVVIRYIKV